MDVETMRGDRPLDMAVQRREISLTRRCVADQARLRGRERWSNADDIFEYFEALNVDMSSVSIECAEEAIFEQPMWTFDGLWMASRRKAAAGELVKMWRLGRPKTRRRHGFDRDACLTALSRAIEAGVPA